MWSVWLGLSVWHVFFIGTVSSGSCARRASSDQEAKLDCLAWSSVHYTLHTPDKLHSFCAFNVLYQTNNSSVTLHLVSRSEVDQRAHVRAGVEPVSDSKGPDSLRHLGDKRVVDPLLDHVPVGGNADLSTEPELCSDGSIDGAVEIGIVENLCTQLSDTARS